MLHSEITCFRETAVGFMKNVDTRITGSQFICKIPGAISRPIIDKQQLKIPERLY